MWNDPGEVCDEERNVDMISNLRPIIRSLDYRQTEEALDLKVKETIDAINYSSYDFSCYEKKIFTKNGKRRIVYSFEKLSVENILCHYLKKEIDKAFHVRYSSRSKIMHEVFNTLPVIKDMNDFVIVRADFKDFFNSILTSHVYENYIQNATLRRADKDIIEKYVDEFEFCYAGLCLSNEMAEIVCRDFDRLIKAKLEQYGLFFYERYVDDMIIMLKSYLDQDTFLNIFEQAIKEVFNRCPVKLNMESDKFSFISCRDLQQLSIANNKTSTEKITFLGYEFFINYTETDKNHNITFRYGISSKKRDRYRNIIDLAFIDYRKNGNVELFRQRLKLFSTRIVVSRSLGNNRIEWLTNGITSNYCELRNCLEDLDIETETYLKELFSRLLVKNGLSEPYFLRTSQDQNSVYNLYSCLERNRTIVFDKKIGVQREDLVRWIQKLCPHYRSDNKRYYQIVMEYIEILNLNNSTISEEMALSETV